MMAVDVSPGDEFQAGRPAPFIDPFPLGSFPVRNYDVFADGPFVSAVNYDDRPREARVGVTEWHVVLTWFEELKARVWN